MPLDVCATVEKVTGKKCEFKEYGVEGYQGSKELFDNLMMIREYGYYGPGAKEGVKRSQDIVGRVRGWEGLGSFDDYLSGVGFGK